MKIAKVGYGRDGRGVGKTDGGYAYLVNNNVRTGDVIQPIATSSKGRKFVTTGKVNSSYKETSVTGIEEKQKAQSQSKNGEITRAYTGKELGVSNVPISPTTTKGYPMPYSSGKITEYNKLTRGLQVEKYQQQHPQSQFTKEAKTYDEYAKQFMTEEQ